MSIATNAFRIEKGNTERLVNAAYFVESALSFLLKKDEQANNRKKFENPDGVFGIGDDKSFIF